MRICPVPLVVAGVAMGCSSPPAPPSRQEAAPAAAAPVVAPRRLYPEVSTDARPGEAVMIAYERDAQAPSQRIPPETPVHFRAARMIEPGPVASRVDLIGEGVVTVPNAGIIRFPAEARATRGDTVLSASSMLEDGDLELATVVGATSRSPLVRPHADGRLRPVAGDDRRLRPGHFVSLGGPFSTGSSVACRGADGVAHVGLVIRADGDQVLVRRWEHRLVVEPRATCVAMPVHATVAVGDTVLGEYAGDGLQSFTVDAVSAELGVIHVSQPFTIEEPGQTLRSRWDTSFGFSMFLPVSPRAAQ